MDPHSQEDPDTDLMTVYDFTRRGEDLHSQLQAFAALLGVSTQTCDTIAAWMYYHTISLYLSGVFDGTLFGGRSAAQLSENERTGHIEGILQRSDEVLQQSEVSHVFLLLPLRIAGNRCSNMTSCREVMRRIDDLQSHFAIAGTVKNELLKEWSSRSLYTR